MKISKFEKIVEKTGYGLMVRVAASGETFLCTKASMYRGGALPKCESVGEFATMLDMNQKKMEKCILKISDAENDGDICGLELWEGYKNEQDAESITTTITVNNDMLKCIKYGGDKLLFFDDKYLAPIKDEIKNSEYFKLAVRETKKGKPYIVAKDGFQVIAAILPLKYLTEETILQMETFATLCRMNWEREQDQESEEEDEDDIQTGNRED